MHSINGYVYGNGPMITMRKGQHVRWYVMSMGTEVDLHTPHWHGNTVTVGGMRTDTVSLLPATMVVADMVPDNVGIWLFHCHVNDHITAGMLSRYQVRN
jgi:hephaestin